MPMSGCAAWVSTPVPAAPTRNTPKAGRLRSAPHAPAARAAANSGSHSWRRVHSTQKLNSRCANSRHGAARSGRWKWSVSRSCTLSVMDGWSSAHAATTVASAPYAEAAATATTPRPTGRACRSRRRATAVPAAARHTPRNRACECLTVNSAASDSETSIVPVQPRPRSTSAQPHRADRVNRSSSPSVIGRIAVTPQGSA